MMRSGSSIWPAWPRAWQLGWPILWRDRWRWLARRWAFALGGFAVGMLGVGGWQFEALQALRETEAQVLDLQAKLQAQVQSELLKPEPVAPVALHAPTGPPLVMAWWPVQGTQAVVWPQLERWMAHHGLRLMSLRPEAPGSVGAWPSQAVALRLQGRFEDWVSAWAALNARGPMWGLERLRITPQEGGVAIDAVLRLWLSPEPTVMSKSVDAYSPTELLPVPVLFAPRHGAGSPVFVGMVSPSTALSGVPVGLKNVDPLPPAAVTVSARPAEILASPLPMPTLSPDPADWPLEQVRLVGVWRQGQGIQPILMAGSHWAMARLGQRVGPQGHVVSSIHAEEVHLRAAQGPVWVIVLEKTKP